MGHWWPCSSPSPAARKRSARRFATGVSRRYSEAPAGRRFSAVIIDEARISAAEAHRQALDAGARALVGPLLKESVQAIAPLAGQRAGRCRDRCPSLP